MRQFFKAAGLALCLALAGAGAGSAQQEDMVLVCSYESTHYIKEGSSKRTSGSTTFKIESLGGNRISIKQSDFGAIYLGEIREGEIIADAKKIIDNIIMKRMVIINRYNGDLQEIVSIGSGELVHVGKCRKQKSPLF